jgi:hypothetical protein
MLVRICVCVYVSCLGSRLGVPAISPSLPDVNKKKFWSKKGRHFDWPLRVLKIGILKIWKKLQNPKDLRILVLFQIWKIPLLSTLPDYGKCRHFSRQYTHINLHRNRRKNGKKLKHFAWPLEVLKSKILKIWKMCQDPEIFRILALFSDLKNSTCKYL